MFIADKYRSILDGMPWLKNLVTGINTHGILFCHHSRALGTCAECAPLADEAYKIHKERK